jgi:hypothetical protein
MYAALGAAAALVTSAATMGQATASQVTVAINNPGGSRTLFVEDMLGQPLTTLDFGTTRAHPFRVRVVDSTMDRAGFAVLTSMSNLYKSTGTTFDYASVITSANVSIDYPTTPINALSVAAIVTPVFDMAETATGTACAALTAAGGTCTIALTAVNGVRQTANLTVDLNKLLTLPIVPQMGDAGSFGSADYNGIGGGDPGKPASFTPSNVRVLSGGVGSDPQMFTDVKTAVQSLVAITPVSQLADPAVVSGALRNAIGGTVYDKLAPAVVSQLMAGLTPTVKDFVSSQIVAQSGTYLSYPSLHVAVPTKAPAGSYQGTLVVTAVQL